MTWGREEAGGQTSTVPNKCAADRPPFPQLVKKYETEVRRSRIREGDEGRALGRPIHRRYLLDGRADEARVVAVDGMYTVGTAHESARSSYEYALI